MEIVPNSYGSVFPDVDKISIEKNKDTKILTRGDHFNSTQIKPVKSQSATSGKVLVTPDNRFNPRRELIQHSTVETLKISVNQDLIKIEQGHYFALFFRILTGFEKGMTLMKSKANQLLTASDNLVITKSTCFS